MKKNYIIVRDRHPRISEVLNDCVSLCVSAAKDEPLSSILQKICAKITSVTSRVQDLEELIEGGISTSFTIDTVVYTFQNGILISAE